MEKLSHSLRQDRIEPNTFFPCARSFEIREGPYLLDDGMAELKKPLATLDRNSPFISIKAFPTTAFEPKGCRQRPSPAGPIHPPLETYRRYAQSGKSRLHSTCIG